VGYADQVFDLTGKVVVVTGGSRGLGRQIATAVARQGADVVIASRKLDACEAAASEISNETGRQTMAYAVHVGRWDELEPFVDAVYDRFGRVDVLFNNAGMSPVYDRLTDVSEKLFDSVINLNFKGPFRLAALIGERMQAAGGGSIINVSSTGAVRPTRDIVPYAAAKAGVNAMTIGLAHAFGPTVRVNAVMPGPFLTTISRAWDMEIFAERARTFPLRRAGQSEEIAGAVLYLASDASTYTTGSILTVDGGAQWSMAGTGDGGPDTRLEVNSSPR
jgi:NAD(P)-dependent dehydrogenase (short-subunit alcohol dehydrogenase family)